MQFPLERRKTIPPRYLPYLSIWKDRLGILDIDTQSKSLKTEWIQRFLSHGNILERFHAISIECNN